MTHALLSLVVAPVDWIGYLAQGGMLQCFWPLTTFFEQAIIVMVAPVFVVMLLQVSTVATYNIAAHYQQLIQSS